MKKTHLSVSIAVLASILFATNIVCADLILYDGFDSYSGDITDGNGGSGNWTGGWVKYLTAGSSLVTTDGLSFGSLATAGGAVASAADVGTANTQYERFFDKGTYFENGDTVWMSILFERGVSNKKIGLTLSNSMTDYIGAGMQCGNGSSQLGASLNGTTLTYGEGAAFNNDEVVFAVMRISIGASITGDGHHAVDLWVNPDPTVDLASVAIGSGDSYTSRAFSGMVNVDRITIVSHNDNAMIFDELRVGTNWADVSPVPEPATLTLLGLGSIAALIRRK